MKNYSISQFKLFHKSQAERAGKYIMGLPTQEFGVESMIVGNIIETYITVGGDIDVITNFEIKKHLDKGILLDLDAINSKVRGGLMNGAEGLKINGEYQVKVQEPLHSKSMLGYIDVLQDDIIIDIKTTGRKTSIDTLGFYGMTKQEEYELQLWYYMKSTGLKKAKIIEIITYEYANGKSIEPIEYEMNWSKEMNEKWTERTKKKIEQMDKIRSSKK